MSFNKMFESTTCCESNMEERIIEDEIGSKSIYDILSNVAHLPSCEDTVLTDWKYETISQLSDIPKLSRNFSDLTDPTVIVRICKSYVSGWSKEKTANIQVSRIMAGLTNQLFKVTCESSETPCVLFRIYGKDVSELYDSKFELEKYKMLANNFIAPKLIGCFEGGRIEEWIEGLPLSVEHASSENVLHAVASILGEFHKIDQRVDLPCKWDRKPSCLEYINSWLKTVKNISLKEELADLKLNKLFEEQKLLPSRLLPEDQPPNFATTIVFSHNDLQENNIMCISSGEYLRLIDFEYSGYNFAGFDVANYFVECCIDYTHPVYPFYKINLTNKPNEEKQTLFAATYLSCVLDRQISRKSCIIGPFLEGIRRMELATHLVWGLWSIVRSPQAHTYEEFDYLHYAKARIKMYWETLEELKRDGLIDNPIQDITDNLETECEMKFDEWSELD